jgi:diguanylate cyclase (GGDEF)-like protein
VIPHFIRFHIARKLLLAVGVPSFALALVGVLWLGSAMRETAPGLWGFVLAFLLVLAFTMSAAHLLAVRLLLEQPLARIVAALKRAEKGDFLIRAPVQSEDELGELARSFNTALAAITDLHARRIDDAQSMESMQRELALKAEVEAQHQLLDDANRRLESRVRELTVLSDLGRTFSSTLKLEDLLNAVVDLAGRTLGYQAFAVLLVDERQGDLVVKSVFGIDAAVGGQRVPLGEGVDGWAAQERRRLLVPDVQADARFPARRWTGHEDGSVLALPMIAQGECVGVLDFFRPVKDGFRDDEVSFLESVASQAAMAIANARLHERTVALSLSDPLTGLSNRRSLFGRLEMEMERSERFSDIFSLAMIDIDHFKLLNETHGHLAGDATLRGVGELLAGFVRRVDTVARYRGEEFALVLPRASKAAALELAEKIRQLVATSAIDYGATQPGGRVTISVGLATFPQDAADLPSLIDCADAALFAAKRQGRNVVVPYVPGMRESPGRKRDVRITAAVEPNGVS